jgi:RNA polymerase sigma-70 factor (ECF subfamily)
VSTLSQTPALRAEALDVARLHAEHASFVWATLQRLGVRDADLEDMLQEVFVVVHKRLHTYDPSARATAWLFGIAVRVAAGYRRRAYRRHEQTVDPFPEPSCEGTGPEASASVLQARRRLEAILDELDLEKRALFVMFEIDELPCEDIAATFGVPVGTIHSRLHAARQAFAKILARHQARDARRFR